MVLFPVYTCASSLLAPGLAFLHLFVSQPKNASPFHSKIVVSSATHRLFLGDSEGFAAMSRNVFPLLFAIFCMILFCLLHAFPRLSMPETTPFWNLSLRRRVKAGGLFRLCYTPSERAPFSPPFERDFSHLFQNFLLLIILATSLSITSPQNPTLPPVCPEQTSSRMSATPEESSPIKNPSRSVSYEPCPSSS